MACVNKSNTDNFLIWNKVAGSLTLAQLQASGMPTVCDNISVDMPTNLTASNPTLTTIDLAWESFSNTIEIYRSADNISFSLIDTLTDSETTYTDTGLSGGTLYYYKVRSVGFISSPYSDTAIGSTIVDFGLALDFDGTNDYVDIGSALDGVSLPAEWTFATYFKGSGGTTTNHIFDTKIGAAPTTERMLFLYQYTGNDFILRLISSSTTYQISFDNSDIVDDNWHRILVRVRSIDGSNNGVSMFVDGVQQTVSYGGSPSSESIVPKAAFTSTFRDKSLLSGTVAAVVLRGALDDVIFANGYATDDEVENDFNDFNGSNVLNDTHGSTFYYRFNKVGAVGGADNTLVTDVTVADDSSGNGYDGTITNFALTGSTSNYVDHD